MYVWRHIPLLRFLIPFVIGILVADKYNLPFTLLALVFAVACISLIVGHYYLKKNVKPRLIFGLSIISIFTIFLAGLLVTSNYKLDTFSKFIGNYEKYDIALARVDDNPQEKDKSISCQVSLSRCYIEDSSYGVVGKAQVYFEKDSLSRSLKYGDYVLLNNSLKPIDGVKNPHQFDFRNYYSNKNIYHQGYVKSNQWVFTGENKSIFRSIPSICKIHLF